MIRLIVKLGLFTAAVAVGHWLISLAPGVRYVPVQYADLEASLAQGCDIVFMGDSTLCQGDEADADQRFTPRMLDDLLPDRTVFNYSQGGYTPEAFLALSQCILRGEHKPDAVILVMNVRCFSPVWDKRPEYQFKRDIAILRWMHTPYHFLLRPYLIFGNFDRAAEEQSAYEQEFVYDGTTPIGRMKAFDNPTYRTVTPENLEKRLIVQYMGDIDPGHRKLTALADCVRLLEANGVRAYVYATPVDWETGVASLGERFVPQIEKNVRVVQQAVEGAGGAFLDCALIFGADVFAWEIDLYPNEHLNQEGRLALARALRDWIDADQRTLRGAP